MDKTVTNTRLKMKTVINYILKYYWIKYEKASY